MVSVLHRGKPGVAAPFLTVLISLSAACASVSSGQTCQIDADCGTDPSLECYFDPPSANEGQCRTKPDAGPRRDGGARFDGGAFDGGGTDGGARDGGFFFRDGGATMDGGGALDGGGDLDGGSAFDGGSSSDGGATQDGGSVQDGGGALDGGAQDGGASLDGGITGIPEVEPNDTRETAHDLTSASTPLVLTGAVDSAEDVDFFRIRSVRGTLLRVTFTPTAGSALDAGFAVVGAEDANLHFVRFGQSFGSNPSATRQVFVPISGDYFVAVYDDTAGGAGAGGGYTLSIATETVPTPTTTAVGTAQSGGLTNGEVRFYSVTPGAGALSATALASTLSPSSDLDTVVTIWDPAAQAVVAEVNDGDTPSGTRTFSTDARAAWLAASGKPYHVLVDHMGLSDPGASAAFRLELASVVAEGTTESNDRFSTSYPLSVAQSALTATMRASTETDWDVYSVYLGANDGVTVTGTGDVVSGNEHLTFFQVVDESGTPRRLGIIDQAFDAVAKFYPGVAGTYYIYVTDFRYLQPGTLPGERPEDAAGTSYRIDLTADASPTVSALASGSTTATLPARGASRYYRVMHPGGVLLAQVVGTSADFVPSASIWESSGAAPGRPRTLYAGVLSDVVALPLEAGDFVIEANELFGFGGAFTLTWRALDVSVSAGTLIGESDTQADSGKNNTCASADVLSGVPAVAFADLTAGDVDFFRFTATGTSVVVRTAGSGFEAVDTSIQLLPSSSTTPIAANDDENATMGQYYSRTSATVTAGQTYCVRVVGKSTTDSGSYALIVTPN